MNTVQDRQMKDVQHHHMYNKLCFSNAIVEDMMFAIVAVVEDENHFVAEIVLNQIDDIVSDDDVIVVDDDERMAVVLEMDDDFVHFVLVVYSFHSIVLSNDH
jgi:hypothetical protein